ncbi:hypothetical protein [Mucilaginibacter dorajii]|uniref:hypothetical protein n=1 Tax=Mucilaginibacter dorajii TaxID=692994 RepID=UPI0021695142|nr:hypothetical protein [Mucilaginibacter dorajii]MCS3732867.1 hypothetical protein [Mucilaginibacter dorajii]
MKRLVYIIFNVICQFIICWLLVLLNAYYNDLVIPQRLARSAEGSGIKMLIAVIEGVSLVLAVYLNNRMTLSDDGDKKSRVSMANKTCKVQLIITVCFIVAVILN